MLRRQARLRREYLYRKTIEDRQKRIQANKNSVKDALEHNKMIHGDLQQKALHYQKKLEWEDAGPEKAVQIGGESGGAFANSQDDEYRYAGVADPKIVITTARDPSTKLKQFAKELRLMFPNSQRMNRGHYEMKQLIQACRANDVTDFIVVHEHRGKPDGLVVCHLPYGPTAYFNMSDVVMRHDIPDIGTMSEQYPHLIFHNFKTALAQRTMSILKYLFPVPKHDSKRVITFANHDDYISFRHHNYRKVDKEIELSEVGPRFQLKLYEIKLGTLDAVDAADTEWALRPYMNTSVKLTGISRSGRVRKKSSKLVDFESPDDIEKIKKQSISPNRKMDLSNISSKKGVDDDYNRSDYAFEEMDGQESASDYEPEHFNDPAAASSESMDDSQSDYEDLAVAERGFRRIDDLVPEPVVPATIFANEKPNKKRFVIKDGKVLNKTKSPRKEKGKAKITAYMLWARETRAKVLLETPKIDFASMSKRLSELWSLVSTGEKDAWQRRAKRLNSKTDTIPDSGADTKLNSRFITTAQQRAKTSKTGNQVSPYQLGMPSVGNSISPESPRSREVYKPGIKPIDVAAHLKLLGESLTIIGERLKEHEGQIAVSGSLSVLLDSLLCALGPLLCLTQCIPQLQENCCTPEQLLQIVDNVAFIMPGL